MSKRILIVEDESDIASALAARLKTEGFAVSVADNGTDGLDMGLNENYDLAILDIMLPGVNGLEIAKKLRETTNTSILVLSARDEENDVVSGLSVGADDYVTKPFSAREVVARVHALLRRKEASQNIDVLSRGMYSFGELQIDGVSHSVTLQGKFVHTTPTEFKLLSVLCAQPGTVFSREDLVEMLTQNLEETAEKNDLLSHSNLRTVDSHVRSLRKKIGSHYIRTVHAVGYSFESDDSKNRVSA